MTILIFQIISWLKSFNLPSKLTYISTQSSSTWSEIMLYLFLIVLLFVLLFCISYFDEKINKPVEGKQNKTKKVNKEISE